MCTSEPLYGPLSSAIPWLTVSKREIVSPGPDLAGLGSVGDDLRVNAPHSDNWPGYMQAIQEQAPRYSSNLGYPGPQMDQYQDGSITHQQLHPIASNATEHQLPHAAIQIPSANPADGSAPLQIQNSQSQQQEQQALEDIHDSGSDEQFNESDYLNDESTNESELCDEEVPTAMVDIPMSDIKHSGHSPDDKAQTAGDDSDSTSGESESADAQEYPARPENGETLDAVSLATVAAPSARDRRALDEAANTTPAEYPTVPEPSLEGSSIVHDRHQASELIKAWEHQGTLADLLGELGYQKPRQPDRTLLTTHPVASVASDSSQVVCDEPNCGKLFPRPCELK